MEVSKLIGMRVLLVIFAATSLIAQQEPRPPQRLSFVFVPFAGCESDGQVGPREKPAGKTVSVAASFFAAGALSYYKAGESGFGILAPRNWYCFGTYGSSGEALLVSPEPLDARKVFSSDFILKGSAIQLSHKYGDTSGRLAVAEIIARIFPAYRDFVAGVRELYKNERIPNGPYPKDVLIYRSERMVEYRTPAQTEGLGTYSRLTPDASPIAGVAMLTGETPDLILLSVRLNPDLNQLAAAIIRNVERETARPRK